MRNGERINEGEGEEISISINVKKNIYIKKKKKMKISHVEGIFLHLFGSKKEK